MINRIMSSLASSVDLETKHLNNGKFEVEIVYLSSMIEHTQINKNVSLPFLVSDSFENFEHAITSCGAEKVADFSQIASFLLQGYVVIGYFSDIYCLSVKRALNNDPEETKTENTVIGPSKAFAEDLFTNLALIRFRYKKRELTVEPYEVGTSSKTKILLAFDASLAKPSMIELVRDKLKAIDVDMLQASGQLEKLLNDTNYSLFPTVLITERPDRAVLNLSHGKAVLLIEGAAFVIVLPAVFFDFMSAMDDLYQSFWITRSLVFLRYVSLVITVLLPAIYVSIVSYNPELFRVQLTLSISGSRSAVPYPSYVEVFIMLFMIEALTEASLRLPKFIGSTATTVGGLILGQAAQQAGLVSSIMIIITSAVAISNYVIPINSMSFAMRFVKYVLIAFASFFGIIGTSVGFFLLISYLASLRSFDEPYLKLFIGEKNVSYPESEGDST
ncbi:spore germination protein [Paenibacillus sp. N3.4]|nr:spore germination protein [Paenibacillus sp. N3.4]